eukprot:3535942-Amphidinium_carterae.1
MVVHRRPSTMGSHQQGPNPSLQGRPQRAADGGYSGRTQQGANRAVLADDTSTPSVSTGWTRNVASAASLVRHEPPLPSRQILQRRKRDAQSAREEPAQTSGKAQGKGAQPDPLMQQDPWEKSKWPAQRSSQGTTTAQSSHPTEPAPDHSRWEDWWKQTHKQTMQMTTTPGADRVDALARRVTQLEEKQDTVASKVTDLDGKVDSLGTSMATQLT